jgi:1-acyl-sn-glycerol-3-phosphate acyltransferase
LVLYTAGSGFGRPGQHRTPGQKRTHIEISAEASYFSGIFPEGTFNETGKPLKSFYDGAFRISIETRTPVKQSCSWIIIPS